MFFLKRFVFCSLAVICCLATAAQSDATVSGIKNFQSVPAFEITAVPDSSTFSSAALKKDKPVVIILFNPDCDHCQNETKELLAWRQEIKHLQIVMVSSAPYDKVKEFYQDYNIQSLANIQMGCDREYKLALLFRATSYPAIYVYDSKGILSKAYVGGARVADIVKAADN